MKRVDKKIVQTFTRPVPCNSAALDDRCGQARRVKIICKEIPVGSCEERTDGRERGRLETGMLGRTCFVN